MSKRMVLFGVVLAVTFIPMIFINTWYGYLPFLFLLILTGCSLLYAFLLKKSFAYEEMASISTLTRGEKAAFQIALQNKGPLLSPYVRVSLYVRNMLDEYVSLDHFVYTIPPRGKKQFEFDITFGHLGHYTIGLQSIRIYDLFLLFSFRFRQTQQISVYVKPVRHDTGELKIQSGNGNASAKVVTMATIVDQDYSSVRDYVPGDPIKHIHWKLSAHALKTMTKKFDNFSDNGISIYLDFSAPEYESNILLQVYDSLVESAYSVASYAIDDQGQEVQLIFGENEVVQVETPRTFEDVQNILERLPVISPAEQTTAVTLLSSIEARQAELDNVLVFTCNLTSDLMYELETVKQRRKNPQLFYIIPQGSTVCQLEGVQQVFRTLSARGIHYYVIESAGQLKEVVGVAS